jgi:hypothetical protein
VELLAGFGHARLCIAVQSDATGALGPLGWKLQLAKHEGDFDVTELGSGQLREHDCKW